MSAMSDSDDSDDWATEDLPNLSSMKTKSQSKTPPEDDSEGEWEQKLPTEKQPSAEASTADPGEPMIIVDMTLLSAQAPDCPEIHSRFDRNSVNDPAAAKQLRLQIEGEYHRYAKHVDYLSAGIVRPCGSSVWRPALERLRREKAGHYFLAIFPPKQK